MRLIDADALKDLEEMEYIYFMSPVGVPFYKADKVWEVIEKAPTIEAEPVRHGWWEPQWEFDFISEVESDVESGADKVCGFCCSLCGLYYTKEYTYCPNCGATMDKADDEEAKV